MKPICILGGGGFVGSHLAARLTEVELRIVSRRPERHAGLRVLPHVKLVQADVHQPEALTTVLDGCGAVINLIGILNETGTDGSGFRQAHETLAANLVNACARAGVTRVVQMSALHADLQGRSHYLRSKGAAEHILATTPGLQTTCLRPSVIFGRDDSFFNRFAGLLRMTPPYAPIPVPCPHAQFAPVWVDDVASAIIAVLRDPTTVGRALPLCGPKIYSHLALWRYTAQRIGARATLVPLNPAFSRLLAHTGDWVGRLSPLDKPFSLDNYHSLQTDSVCMDNAFPGLDITPRALEIVVPQYLGAPH